MSVYSGPENVETGIVLNLDAANPNSYTVPSAVSGTLSVQVLIVAGGGAGGGQGSPNDGSGGGGAGGVINTGLTIEYNNSTTLTLPVVVGLGGTGVAAQTRGNNGQNSSFGGLTAIGGGGGGSETGGLASANRNGAPGGSGGGAGGFATTWLGGPGTAGQGFAGGDNRHNTVNNLGGGGGGGAGGPGAPGKDTGIINTGIGGPGISSNISGTTTFYGGGGGCGGGYFTAGSAGGIGGGGAGGNSNGPSGAGQNGQANTGGGGGGAGATSNGGSATSGSGGSGIVIIRYAGPPQGYGGTITTVDGDTVHTFTASGNFVLTNNRWNDTSGNRYNTVLVENPTYSSANSGSLVFNGTTNYGEISTNLNSSFSSRAITVICWGKISSVVSKNTVLSFNGVFNWFMPGNRLGPTQQLYWDPVTGWLGSTNTTWTVDQWYQFAWTIAADRTLTFYTNGVLDRTTTIAQDFAPVAGASVRVGYANPGEYATGNIASLAVYNTVLTAAEIQQNFQALRSRFGI